MALLSEANPQKAKELAEHDGHVVAIFVYDEESTTIECVTCNEVLAEILLADDGARPLIQQETYDLPDGIPHWNWYVLGARSGYDVFFDWKPSHKKISQRRVCNAVPAASVTEAILYVANDTNGCLASSKLVEPF